ncbi:MAG: histidine phosphatase family protein [Flavobacterium micromati]|nr:histidine phosphatase family protein [Flavobacterium micromati]
MKKYLLIALFLIFQISFGQNNTTTYYFIRHAEKVDASKNPDLSTVGFERARLYDNIFAEIKFDAIYSTDYKRTLQTVTPIAATQKIAIKLYDPKTLSIESFKKENVGKKVLIVGHSNSIPNFVNQIINEKIYPDLADATFGNLYIVVVCDDKINHQLLKLR